MGDNSLTLTGTFSKGDSLLEVEMSIVSSQVYSSGLLGILLSERFLLIRM